MQTQTFALLKEINATDGVRESLIVGRDGFVIEHVGELNAEEVGAILSTAIGAVEAMGRDAGQGRLEEIMGEFDEGVVILAPVGRDAVLGVVARSEVNLGRVRFEVKKRLKELAKTL